MSKTDVPSGVPRALIHKKILDVAESNPDASLETIATEVSGASTDLVDRVLAEYGDPAEEFEQLHTPDTMKESEPTDGEKPDVPVQAPSDLQTGALSDEQRETLRLIYENPDASQRDVADELGISQSTVNHRLNAIESFEWDRREAFCELVFSETGPGLVRDRNGTGESQPAADEHLAERLDEFERRFDDAIAGLQRAVVDANRDETARSPGNPDANPELVQKVLHACLESDRVDEDEELLIIGMLTGNPLQAEDR